MSKTMVSIKKKGYKFVNGHVAGTRAAGAPVTLQFESKIIAVFYRHNYGGKYTTGYYVRPDCDFWKSQKSLFDATYPESNPVCYPYDSSYAVAASGITDTSITLRSAGGNTVAGDCYYTAILEDNSDDAIYLLANTILYTDGTPTSDVEGAIQTMEPNKYKIKSNALINISGATYVNISN